MKPCVNNRVSLGDNSIYEAKRVRTISIQKYVNGQWKKGRIENVLYVPQLKKNLVSVGVCTSHGLEIRFAEHEVLVYGPNKLLAKDNGLLVGRNKKKLEEILTELEKT